MKRVHPLTEHGRGTVYVSTDEPGLSGLRAVIDNAVARYRPHSEGVVVVIRRHDEVDVARLGPPLERAAPLTDR